MTFFGIPFAFVGLLRHRFFLWKVGREASVQHCLRMVEGDGSVPALLLGCLFQRLYQLH